MSERRIQPTNPRFTPDAIAFLRALKRNNDRDWFKARKARYDTVLRGPMIALIERLAGDFRAFAPELVASPRTSLYRIYRDTRFSANKAPLKTHIAAVFPCRGLARHQGAGLYLEIAPGASGSVEASTPRTPPSSTPCASTSPRTRGASGRSSSRQRFASALVRWAASGCNACPAVFRKTIRLAEYLKFRQFLAGRDFPPSFASSPQFYRGVLRVFRQVAPLTRFLNEPLLGLGNMGEVGK